MTFRVPTILLAAPLLLLAACESQRPATKAGQALDRAGSEAGRAVGHAAQETGAAFHRAGDWIRARTR